MEDKPEVGEKLNKPAIITFFNFGITKEEEDFEKYLKKLRKWVRRNDMNFVSYDPEDQTLVVEVENF